MITLTTHITWDVNDENAIYITRHPDWGTKWERLLDGDGNPFSDINDAIVYLRSQCVKDSPIPYAGLSTHTHMTRGNILWDNL